LWGLRVAGRHPIFKCAIIGCNLSDGIAPAMASFRPHADTPDPRRFTTAPTADELIAMAESVLATLPAALLRFVSNVVIRVEEFPDEETELEMGLESPFDLLGLYRGIALTDRSNTHPPLTPDEIYLYRRPLLDHWCESEEDLAHLVRHVLIHEIGHHFGFSDEDMERIEAESD